MDVNKKQLPDQDLDGWLDAALRARAEAEPRMGLEDRILARLAIESARKSFPWRPMFAVVAAGFVVAITMVVFYLGIPKRDVVSVAPRARATREAIQSADTQADRATERADAARRKMRDLPIRHVSQHVHQQGLPRLATFPSPSPQTDQERVLARLAARRGAYDVAAASDDMVPLKDLSVPKLNIQPMEGSPPDDTPQE